MKRAKAADRVVGLANLYTLLAATALENGQYEAADAYEHAARFADREAYKIREKL